MAIPLQETEYTLGLPALPRIALDAAPASGARLNIILPHCIKKYAFGGVASAVELSLVLAKRYPAARFLSLSPLDLPENMFDFSAAHSEAELLSLDSNADEQIVLDCHANEIFLCTYWTGVRIRQAYAQAMRDRGLTPPPFYYLIQDYEPGFYPYGAKFALAEATYQHGQECHAIFNSQELAQFFAAQGYTFGSATVIHPSLNRVLHERLEQLDFQLPPKPRACTNVLVYGRPEQPRNCFSALCEGLYRFCRDRTFDQPIRFFSAGQPHDDVELAPGVVLESLGMLSLPAYVGTLLRSHVGVSLMVSPHPSYPPLEMATFGLQTVTNRFATKDLADTHPGIVSIDSPEPASIAAGLELAVQRAQASPPRRAQLPTSLSDAPWIHNVINAGIPQLPLD